MHHYRGNNVHSRNTSFHKDEQCVCSGNCESGDQEFYTRVRDVLSAGVCDKYFDSYYGDNFDLDCGNHFYMNYGDHFDSNQHTGSVVRPAPSR